MGEKEVKQKNANSYQIAEKYYELFDCATISKKDNIRRSIMEEKI